MTTKFSYEKAISEVEKLVDDIENGRLDVDQISEAVVRIGDLLKKCKQKLTDTRALVDNINDEIKK